MFPNEPNNGRQREAGYTAAKLESIDERLIRIEQLLIVRVDWERHIDGVVAERGIKLETLERGWAGLNDLQSTVKKHDEAIAILKNRDTIAYVIGGVGGLVAAVATWLGLKPH